MLQHQQTRFEKLLSFLHGASWALALAGGGYTFLLFLPFGTIIASLIALFFFLSGCFFVIIFSMAQLQLDKFEELKKQTQLLEKLSLNDQTLSHH
ncbi:hypothetical protein [Sulfurospirillum halorespirans]|uniref:Uncharacterized protein n=1 Tax=Sulfurospirillum halorespirans DSM 13726 TaxID=1193502 RepID=A0A1D7TJI4_9BACT|nr:hypothetical protein [Sulfurospirillum halorespirans]AOO65151.1 hypothetical protein SHALO_1375 [Sulfurospirillum halorespirans DSM 13726]